MIAAAPPGRCLSRERVMDQNFDRRLVLCMYCAESQMSKYVADAMEERRPVPQHIDWTM